MKYVLQEKGVSACNSSGRHVRSMAGLDADLETAFSIGDPEAVLDFLVHRSRQMLYEADEAASLLGSGPPHFATDSDLAAFVRDLTIDDAISHCFADLPSSCDVNSVVTSSSQAQLPSRPEKKLTDPKIAREAEPLQKHASFHGKRSATVKPQSQSPSHSASSSVSGGNSRGKSRGFLSSLLGRGHKGRRGEEPRKASPHPPRDPSSKQTHPPSSHGEAESEKKTVSPDRELVAHARINGDHVASACLSEPILTHGESADVPQKQAIVRKQARTEQECQLLDSGQVKERKARQTTSDGDPACVIEFCFSPSAGQVLDSVEHKLDHHSAVTGMVSDLHHRHTACGDLGSSSTHAQTLTKRPPASDPSICPHTHLPTSSGNSPPKHTDKAGSSQQSGRPGNLAHKPHPQTPTPPPPLTRPALEKTGTSAAVHSAQHTPAPSGEEDQTLTRQTPWEGICHGLDAFIDFERDPNLEVPLGGGHPLSAGFDFSRTSSEAGVPEQERQRAGPLDICPHSESSHLALQTCALTPAERLLKAGAQLPVPTATAPKCTPVSMSQHLLPSQSSPGTLSKVSAGTQTETYNLEPEQAACVSPRVDHCLRTAVAQLSALSACSTCQDVISRTIADLKKALLDIESDAWRENHRNPEPVPHRHSRVPHREKQTDNTTLADEAASENLHRVEESSPASSHSTETSRLPGQNRPRHHEAEMLGHGKDGHPKAGATPLSKQSSQSRSCHGHRSRQSGVGKKRTMSSRASADSDSASTSTVTSEPVTVLVCQRATPSSSGSSKAGLSLKKVPAPSVPSFSVDVDSVSADKSESPNPAQSFGDPTHTPSTEHKTQMVAMPCETTTTTTSAAVLFRTPSRPRKDARNTSRYAGEVERDYESFMTSSWSEMTSVSSVSDTVTSADESSYYSGDDDDNEDEDEEEEEEEEDDLTAVVRLGLLDEDRDDSELRQHRLQRHLAAVLRQNSIPASTVETVVAATGERLNGQDRQGKHVNQGSLYPFSGQGTPAGHESEPPLAAAAAAAVLASGCRGRGGLSSVGPPPPASATAPGRETRPAKKGKKGTGPRLFSPERQVALIAARQMTSGEFREAYDRSTDVAKAKRSQLDGDIPWDLIPCSDTDDDGGSEKAWYQVTSEEESVAHVYGSDTDSSTTVSDW